MRTRMCPPHLVGCDGLSSPSFPPSFLTHTVSTEKLTVHPFNMLTISIDLLTFIQLCLTLSFLFLPRPLPSQSHSAGMPGDIVLSSSVLCLTSPLGAPSGSFDWADWIESIHFGPYSPLYEWYTSNSLRWSLPPPPAESTSVWYPPQPPPPRPRRSAPTQGSTRPSPIHRRRLSSHASLTALPESSTMTWEELAFSAGTH